MPITSNIAKVQARFERIGSGIPTAASKHIRANDLYADFRRIAEQTLEFVFSDGWLPNPSEQSAILILLGTLLVSQSGQVFSIRMGGISWDKLANPDDYRSVIASEDFEQKILDWINSGTKDKKEIDYNPDGSLDLEGMVYRITQSLRKNPETWFATDLAGRGALNPKGLAQFAHIVPITPERLVQGLAAVLDAWKAYAVIKMPELAHQGLKDLIAH